MQRGYLWQRDWTPSVEDAFKEGDRRMDGVVVLGAEVDWKGGAPQVIATTIPWALLKQTKKPCSLALRIGAYPGPFSESEGAITTIGREARSLLEEARAQGIVLKEFQVDFDCAQSKLGGYCAWLRAIAKVVRPARLVITTLPAWLDEPEFAALIKETDGFVLQVHSVPTLAESRHAVLCDPILARRWVAKASRFGMPFSVALPTYWCLAGYDSTGKLIGVAMDSVQPSWPPGTRSLEFATNADEIAGLVRDWQSHRPAGMRELLWYRLPVETDLRNWRWPTLLAVMAGRSPIHRLQIIQEGDGPVDFSILNCGEADEQLDCDAVIRWKDSMPVALDALFGWTMKQEEDKVVFTTERDYKLKLSPGAKIAIGWIRFEKIPALRAEIVRHVENTP